MNRIQIKATLAVAGMMAAFSVSAQNSSLDGFTAVPDGTSGPVSDEFMFNGYTNHWQNVYRQQYRYGNLYRINIPDLDKTIAQSRRDLADKLGIPGLQMQEGFFASLAAAPEYRILDNPDEAAISGAFASCSDVVVIADRGSALAQELESRNPVVFPELPSYQVKAEGFRTLDAFFLKNGDKTLYVVSGDRGDIGKFRRIVCGALEVTEKYDLKRGWFGTGTNIRTVSCSPGTPIDVMSRGMNEGNSWFVFSGGYETFAEDDIKVWAAEAGIPVVTDMGASPLFGCDDWKGFQSQLMGGWDSWTDLKARKHGYLFKRVGPDKGETDRNPDAEFDGYFAQVGHEKQINSSDKPFVIMTGNLLRGTENCMVLFTAKDGTFDRDGMWNAIMDRRSVAIGENGTVMGSDLFRQSVQLMMLDRVWLEEYFGDRIDISAETEGTCLHVTLTNLYDHDVTGVFSLKLPSQISADGNMESTVSLPAGGSREISIDLNPSPEAMGRLSAMAVKFDWNGSSKAVMAKLDMPPAVSVHQLLYGPSSGTGFPVSIYNFTGDGNVDVDLAVFRKDNPDKAVFRDNASLRLSKGSSGNLSFDLDLKPGNYIVRTKAMGVTAETQLGIGKVKGDVTLEARDLNGDGVDEYIMENSQVRVTLLTTGARVIEYIVKDKGDNVFFKLWPDKPEDVDRPFREWAFWPFGGFEDFLGQASMETHKVYDAEIVRDGGDYAEVRMTAGYYGNTIEKTFTLYGDTPLLGIRFAMDMTNPELDVFGPQPMLSLGDTHGTEDKFIIPETGGIQEYVMDPERMWGKILDLQEGWNAGYDTEADISFVGAYPVHRPFFLHMWMNLESNPDSHYPYIELQPWVPLYHGATSYFSYYMWADGDSWETGLEALRERNLITER